MTVTPRSSLCPGECAMASDTPGFFLGQPGWEEPPLQNPGPLSAPRTGRGSSSGRCLLAPRREGTTALQTSPEGTHVSGWWRARWELPWRGRVCCPRWAEAGQPPAEAAPQTFCPLPGPGTRGCPLAPCSEPGLLPVASSMPPAVLPQWQQERGSWGPVAVRLSPRVALLLTLSGTEGLV